MAKKPFSDDSHSTPLVRSVGRALNVLELLSRTPRPQTLSDLSRQLDIPKSTLLGILRTLEGCDWAVERDGRYSLGVEALLVGASFIDSDPVVHRTAPWLDRLAVETTETVHLGRLDGPSIVYMAKRESSHALRMFSAIGRRVPAHATALGKAILATLSDDEVRSVLGTDLQALTPSTVVDLEAFLADLRAVRDRGWAVEREESSEGIVCLAVDIPVSGATRDAVSVSVPVQRLTPSSESQIVEALVDVRRQALRLEL